MGGTLSGGPILPLLQVSLQSEHSRYVIWTGSVFEALGFILCLILYNLSYVPLLHPCQRDTGKVDIQGPNIMSPKGRILQPEGCRAQLQAQVLSFSALVVFSIDD